MMSTVKGKGKARDNNIVSLNFTEDECEGLAEAEDEEMGKVLPSLNYNSNHNLGTTEYNVNHKVAELTGHKNFLRQVHSTHCDETKTVRKLPTNGTLIHFSLLSPDPNKLLNCYIMPYALYNQWLNTWN